MMDKVRKPSNSEYYTPLSELFRMYLRDGFSTGGKGGTCVYRPAEGACFEGQTFHFHKHVSVVTDRLMLGIIDHASCVVGWGHTSAQNASVASHVVTSVVEIERNQ
jgi:hypothetical protein